MFQRTQSCVVQATTDEAFSTSDVNKDSRVSGMLSFSSMPKLGTSNDHASESKAQPRPWPVREDFLSPDDEVIWYAVFLHEFTHLSHFTLVTGLYGQDGMPKCNVEKASLLGVLQNGSLRQLVSQSKTGRTIQMIPVN